MEIRQLKTFRAVAKLLSFKQAARHLHYAQSSISAQIQALEEELEVRFGPGPIRKRFKLNEIESYKIVRNPWYYGWGIRLTPHEVLFRVSGFYAVEIQLITDKNYIIGTDVPQELEIAIQRAFLKI